MALLSLVATLLPFMAALRHLARAALVAFLAAGCANGPEWDTNSFPYQMSYSNAAPPPPTTTGMGSVEVRLFR